MSMAGAARVVVRADKSLDELTFGFHPDQRALADRFRAQAGAFTYACAIRGDCLVFAYIDGLDVLRELVPAQRTWGFVFGFDDDASRTAVTAFIKRLKDQKTGANQQLTAEELQRRLEGKGFNKRALKSHQLRDLARLAAMPHGANFSVPGAGKTTVTLALNTVAMESDSRMLVVAPKAAFIAWEEVVADCFDASSGTIFRRLTEDRDEVIRTLRGGYPRLVVNYEMMVSVAPDIRRYLTAAPSHLVMDESHRIKAGAKSLRGEVALAIGSAATRRDILSGTPMPQGSNDIAAQADFAWPGEGVGRAIRQGTEPRVALAGRFVRTTKSELNLPPRHEQFVEVPMGEAQLALYGLVTQKALKQLQLAHGARSVPDARGAMHRMFQASVNPVLTGVAFDGPNAVFEAAVHEAAAAGGSPKILKAVELARQNAQLGRKTVIWTIYTETLRPLRNKLMDIGAVAIFGGNGQPGELTRDEAIARFTAASDSSMVLVANPMAASEGLSLHEVCHEAVYVDRSYNAAHFLQSIDRIHRLGLDPDTSTRIQILHSVTPEGIGNIDRSVGRRLERKVSSLRALLDDPDLAEIAMAEDDALNDGVGIDTLTDVDDIADLIVEIQGKALLGGGS